MDRRDFLKISGLAAVGLSAGNIAEAAQSLSGKAQKKAAKSTLKADVVVCGGGPAGIGAAVEAARQGMKVILIEHEGFLGGTWTAGLLGVMLDHRNKKGLLKELKDTLVARNWRTRIKTGHLFTFNVERMKLLLDEICEKEGVKVLLYTSIVDTIVKRGRITHVITESKSGRESVEGKIFIDATGDGDVAALSGCGFDWGNDEGATQPMSMLGLVCGLNFDEISDCALWDGHGNSKSKTNLIAEIRRGGYEATYKRPCLFPLDNDLYALMACHQFGYKSINRDDITKASIEGRREVNKIVDSLASLGGRWGGIKLVSTASHIGCREGRRIHGLYTVTKDDLMAGTRFDDAVCEVTFGVDVHSVHSNHEGKKSYNQGVKSKPYDIPLRALIPKDVKGLLLAGRCISGDFIAHSSYRVNSNSVIMGQSAGRVAAKSVRDGIEPENIKFHYTELYQ